MLMLIDCLPRALVNFPARLSSAFMLWWCGAHGLLLGSASSQVWRPPNMGQSLSSFHRSSRTSSNVLEIGADVHSKFNTATRVISLQEGISG